MLSHLGSTRSQAASYNQLVFEFIKQTDQFIEAVGKRAAAIRSRSDQNAAQVVEYIADSKIASKSLSSSLASLNSALSDDSFQNSILGIQRALNEIIWKYSGVRRYCIGLRSKGYPMPVKSPLNHMVNQLDGEIFRAVRKITDSLEFASERYYGIERIQDNHFDIYEIERELEQYEYYEPTHEATFVILESQKYQIREILNMYGIEPKQIVKRPAVPKNLNTSEHIGSPIKYEAIEDAAQKVEDKVTRKIDKIEQKLAESVLSLQHRLDDLQSNLNRKPVISEENVHQMLNEKLRPISVKQVKREEEAKVILSQLHQLADINEQLQRRIDQAEGELEHNLAPIHKKLEKAQKNDDVITGQIDKILVIMNEKYSFLESKIPSQQNTVSPRDLKKVIENLTQKIDDNTYRIDRLSGKVEEVEKRQTQMVKNINERFNNLVHMMREEMHIISKNRVDKMIRKFIDYMKGTNGEQKTH